MMDKVWIQTYTGKRFHILNPVSEEVDIRDIAHALSNLCRYTGQTKSFYSVGQHAFYVSNQVPSEDALWGLLHDAAEAYIGDLSRPLKHFTTAGSYFQDIEAKIMGVVSAHFNLDYTQPLSVGEADNRMLYAEKRQLMEPVEWDTKWSDEQEAKVTITSWPPGTAERLFLSRYVELTGNTLEGF